MFLSKSSKATKAVWILLFATSLWGTTFLLMKVLGHCQEKLVPNGSSWFFSSVSVLVRFGAAFLVLLAWQWGNLRKITRQELSQGVALGIFAGLGLIFQMDGVQYTPASTSAFLTQFYCIVIPVYMALKNRRLPKTYMMLSCLMVLIGVGVLANVNWAQLRLGRGEAETIVASLLFTGQILWLEKPVYAANDWRRTTLVMFGVVALVDLPITMATAPQLSDILRAYSTPATVAVALFLIFACTVMTYSMMNFWQPAISSTHASLIYCTEPVFASVFALFAPGIISSIAGIDYPNETVTLRLLMGGGLILAANIIMFQQASRPSESSSKAPPASTIQAL